MQIDCSGRKFSLTINENCPRIPTLTRSSLMSSHIHSHSHLFHRFSSYFISGIRNEYVRLNGSLFLRSRQRLLRAEAFLISSFMSLFFWFRLLVGCPSFLSISIFFFTREYKCTKQTQLEFEELFLLFFYLFFPYFIFIRSPTARGPFVTAQWNIYYPDTRY